MKITVKIGDIEVSVERPNMEEPFDQSDRYNLLMNDIIPSIRTCSEEATQLYKLKHHEKDI